MRFNGVGLIKNDIAVFTFSVGLLGGKYSKVCACVCDVSFSHVELETTFIKQIWYFNSLWSKGGNYTIIYGENRKAYNLLA